jgi:hypothetical protein
VIRPTVAGDTNDWADIYVLDKQTGQVTIESVDDHGTPLSGTCAAPRLNGDGRYLTFDSAVHAEDDPNAYPDRPHLPAPTACSNPVIALIELPIS